MLATRRAPGSVGGRSTPDESAIVAFTQFLLAMSRGDLGSAAQAQDSLDELGFEVRVRGLQPTPMIHAN